MKSNIFKIIGIIILLSISFLAGHQWQNKCISQVETVDKSHAYLPSYSFNINYEKLILDSLKIDNGVSLDENLKAVCTQLSYKSFYSLPIIIDSLSNVKGEKILFVNLLETIGKKTWNRHMFQGSTGGYITTNTLLENFLQRDYHGEWIDGLLVSYEGAPFSEMDYYDHMGGLIGIQWRDSI